MSAGLKTPTSAGSHACSRVAPLASFSAAVGSVNNLGPGLGAVGPSTNFSALSDVQTWICTVAMLIGRLEIFSVLVLFTAHFWRK